MVRFVPLAFVAGCTVLSVGVFGVLRGSNPLSQVAQVTTSGDTTATYPQTTTTDTTTTTTTEQPTSASLTTDPTNTQPVPQTATSLTTTQPQYVQCPFHPTSGQILADFTFGGSVSIGTLALRANGTISDATRGPLALSLNTGYYKLWLASYAPGDTSGQYDRQSWYLVMEDAAHAVVAKSDPTPDIPTGATLFADTAPRGILLTGQVVGLYARHAAYSTSLGNYIVPLCALFERVDTTTTVKTADTVTPTTSGSNTVTTNENTSAAPTASTEEAPPDSTTTEPEAPAPIVTVPPCPFPVRADRTIVSFSAASNGVLESKVIANGSSDAARVHRRATLLAGTYSIRLASYDGGLPDSDDQTWYAALHDATGVLVAKTPPSRDIPGWDDTFVAKVSDDLVLTRDVGMVDAIHTRYPGNLAYAVVPLCAAFDRINSTTTEPLPEPSTSPTTVTAPPPPPQQTTLQQPIVRTTTTVITPPAAPTPLATPADEDGGVPVAPATIGIASSLKTVSVQPEVLAVREQAVKGFTETPFTLLDEGSLVEREAVVRELVGHGTSSPRAGTTSTTTARLPVSLTRIVADDSTSSPAVATTTGTALRERVGLIAVRDTDGDGVSDYDEERLYGSDPENPFTAGGVLSDGERVLLGLDPLRTDLVPVVTESPRSAGETIEKLAIVESLSLATSSRTSTTPGAGAISEQVVVKGYTKPLAYVTLYLYSTPIVVTVRADAGGAFAYTFDETLENGSHELYVASVNNTGKVLAKSEPIPFVKTAQAIEYTPLSAPPANPVDKAARTMATLGSLALLFAGLIALVWIGMRRTQGADQPPHGNA